MSYEVLARRWRPQGFDDLVGQRHVAVTLAHAIESDRLPHAILLAGPRGVGKTSIARILARALNCDSAPTTTPCGECGSCRDIAAGTSLNVQEIDAASNTGVDSVRDIRDSIRYTAGPGKYRIFIVDEVHMLSTAAFNALLKTLEEPPPRSLFVLATTEAQKIPATVLSRVQRFDLRRLPSADALERLSQIVHAEQIEVPESVLRALVRESDGSLRDALTLLDRLLSGLGKKIDASEAAAILDWIDRPLLDDVLDAVLAADGAAALQATRRALDAGADPARLAGDLLVELRNLIVAKLSDQPAELIDESADQVAAIRARAEKQDVEGLQRLFRVLLSRTTELGNGPRPELALEMAIVRLATLPDTESITSLLARLDAPTSGPPPDAAPKSRSGGASGGGTSGSGSRATSQAKSARKHGASGDETARAASGDRAAPPPPAGPEPAAAAPAGPRSPAAPAEWRGPEPRDPEREMQLRALAKQHPAVTRAIQVLDAEIREIRVGPER